MMEVSFFLKNSSEVGHYAVLKKLNSDGTTGWSENYSSVIMSDGLLQEKWFYNSWYSV